MHGAISSELSWLGHNALIASGLDSVDAEDTSVSSMNKRREALGIILFGASVHVLTDTPYCNSCIDGRRRNKSYLTSLVPSPSSFLSLVAHNFRQDIDILIRLPEKDFVRP